MRVSRFCDRVCPSAVSSAGGYRLERSSASDFAKLSTSLPESPPNNAMPSVSSGLYPDIIQDEVAQYIRVPDRVDAVERVVGLHEGEKGVRLVINRRYFLEMLERMVRPAFAAERRIDRRVRRSAQVPERIVVGAVEQE